MRVTTQCGIVWMAMALMVSTRLWLGGAISTRRDQRLLTQVVALIAASAIVARLLLVVDGFASYVDALRPAFRPRCLMADAARRAKCPGPRWSSARWSSSMRASAWGE